MLLCEGPHPQLEAESAGCGALCGLAGTCEARGREGVFGGRGIARWDAVRSEPEGVSPCGNQVFFGLYRYNVLVYDYVFDNAQRMAQRDTGEAVVYVRSLLNR